MKNSKFLKLISLALTVALLVAVAVPTLTSSAVDTTEPNYTRSILKDFEDGVVNTGWAYSVANTSEVGGHGEKCLNMAVNSGGNNDYVFKDTLLKAGHKYYISFYANVYEISTRDNAAWVSLAYYDGTTFKGTVGTPVSTTGIWSFVNCTYTPTIDCSVGFVTNDGTYIDNVCVFDVTESATTEWYQAADGNADLANEGLIIPEGNTFKVENKFDADSGTYVTTFKMRGYGDENAYIPFSFKAGKKYRIGFEFYSDGTNSSNSTSDNPHVFRTYVGNSDTDNITYWCYPSPTSTPKWTTFSKVVAVSKDYNGIHFDCSNAAGKYTTLKIRYAYICEISDESTATKQVYNFDSHDFKTYTDQTNANKSIVVAEKDGKKTLALKANCKNTAVAQVNPQLDMPLTAGKYYKMSYDVKGKGDIAITMTSGGWGSSQYKTEMFGSEATGLVIDTTNWKHRSTVFSAKYNSTHMYIRVSAGTEVYFDNITIEEYTPFEQEMATFDDGYESANGYSVVDDPVAENVGNKVLKNNNGSFQYFVLNSARFVPGHTYEVSFKYYGTAWFRTDITSTNFNTATPVKSYEGISPTTTWKTARYIITATDAMNMSTFAVMCNGTVYFDNFTITDISNFDANNNLLDYSSDSGAFITTNSVTTVTKEVDDRDETKKVTKITFSNSSHYDNSKISVPFSLQKDKTYKIEITYKANTFVAISWDDKSLGDAGLNATNIWTTATRYAKGTTGDMPYFAVPPTSTGTELYIADITITEATAEGGLNGDGVIDATDYVLMRSRFFSAKRDDASMFEKYADQNSDGTVDVLDMVLLSKIGK